MYAYVLSHATGKCLCGFSGKDTEFADIRCVRALHVELLMQVVNVDLRFCRFFPPLHLFI